MAHKLKITISVDEPLMDWLDKEIKKKKFWSRSHGFSYALEMVKTGKINDDSPD